ncbi:MAG: ACT domain-containing protein [Veillonellaceae bacterium]|nr:ACT domain-containing protein [Veillonellaceae bacterium]
MKKVVITVIGLDRVGIIAAVTRILAAKNINVLSINQTILDQFFNMVLLGDMTDTSTDVRELQEELAALGTEMGLEIRAQLADVFYAMHRI